MSKPIKLCNFNMIAKSVEEYLRRLDADLQQLYTKFITLFEVNKLRVGSDSNYTQIDTDGSVSLHGTASSWEDLQVDISNIRLPASAAPSFVSYRGSEVLAFAKAATNIIYFSAQMSHTYMYNTDVYYHLHLVYPDTNTGTSIWSFTYSVADINTTFPVQSAISATVIATGTANAHIYFPFGVALPTCSALSTIALCSLSRVGDTATDTYDNDVYLIASDFHYQRDGFGSKEELTK